MMSLRPHCVRNLVLFTLALLGTAAPLSAGFLGFGAPKDADVNVVVDMTEAGRKVAPPTKEKPAFYFPVLAGYREAGSLVAGEKNPPQNNVAKLLAKALAAQHYYVMGTTTPAPTIILVFHWGYMNPQIDDTGDDENPQQIFWNQKEMLALVAGNTVILKPLTPQNIVIGGASGAMPPVLGWAAMTNDVGPEALILFLIIFLWTPPHFWALALYRVEDYRKSGLPMLPVTHGNEFTRLQVLLYTIVLMASCLMPFAYGMSSWLYLAAAVILSVMFIGYAWALWRNYSDELARKTFKFSLIHLSVLFAALLVDHYLF